MDYKEMAQKMFEEPDSSSQDRAIMLYVLSELKDLNSNFSRVGDTLSRLITRSELGANK